jgi:hypothetical protein
MDFTDGHGERQRAIWSCAVMGSLRLRRRAADNPCESVKSVVAYCTRSLNSLERASQAAA